MKDNELKAYFLCGAKCKARKEEAKKTAELQQQALFAIQNPEPPDKTGTYVVVAGLIIVVGVIGFIIYLKMKNKNG